MQKYSVYIWFYDPCLILFDLLSVYIQHLHAFITLTFSPPSRSMSGSNFTIPLEMFLYEIRLFVRKQVTGNLFL